MPYTESTYQGDSEYRIVATGDCCTGDEVRFTQAEFSGSFRHPKFTGYRLVTGRIVKDSYGADKQQHTFTLALPTGGTMRIKGRNLYRNGVWRKPWADETARRAVLVEKHGRGDKTRAARTERIAERDTQLFS